MSKVKVGNITDSCLGKMLDAEKNKGDYEPYLANVNVRWGSFDLDNLSQMKFEPDEQVRYGLNDGDLIMCEGGEPGRCAIWHNEVPNMKIQKALHRIRPHDCLDIRFLYYWFLLAGRMGWLTRYFTETTIKHLPGESLKDVELDLPKLSIQQGIADVLSAIDDKIILNKRINAELEAMAKTIYDYWFVQFDFPNENGKPYRTSGGAMEYNDQLKREIPKGWSVKRVSELTAVVTGKEDANFSTADGKYKFFTCSQDTLLCDSPAFEGHAVLIAGNGDFNVKHYTGKFNAYQRTYVLIPTDDKFYGCMYIVSNDKVSAFKTGSNGSIVKFITKSDVEGITVFDVPQISLYNSINSIIYRIEHLDRENAELTRLRDWLLPMLMNGQVTVADEQPTETSQNVVEMLGNNKRFNLWLQNQGIAARGDLDKKTLREIFDAMDDDDK